MANIFGLKVEFDHIPELIASLDDEMGKVTRKAAFDTQAHAMANIQSQGAIDTGATLNGVYVVTADQSGYGQASGAVERRRPGHALPTGDELDGVQNAKASAAIAVATDYGPYIEFGTAHMPARPFLIPAFDEETAAIEAIAKLVFLTKF